MKRFFRSFALTSVLLLVSFAGCIDFDLDLVFFENPLVAPEKAEVHRELFGSFILGSDEVEKTEVDEVFGFSEEILDQPLSSVIHIARAGEGFPAGMVRNLFVDIDSEGEMVADDLGIPWFVFKVDETYVVNIPVSIHEADQKDNDHGQKDVENPKDEVKKESGKKEKGQDESEGGEPQVRITKWVPEDYEGYDIYLLKPTKTGFSIHAINGEYFESAISAKLLTGEGATVKANTKELQDFFKKHKKRIFSDETLFTLKRIK